MSKLVVVPTPIGNLKDITLRALEVLNSVNIILAEDTRTSSKLLNHFNISGKQLIAHHKFNEHKSLDNVINKIKSGETIALISDAGTPAISDPGFLIVRECLNNNIEVETLPGATALIPALINSGLPNDRFVFEGFLPQKKGRQTRLKSLINEEKTMVFYESPHRLVKTLTQFLEIFGENRVVSVSRELSKLYEENFRGKIGDVINHFNNKAIKGEIVIVVDGNKNSQQTDVNEEEL